jgi:hypothetical protein
MSMCKCMCVPVCFSESSLVGIECGCGDVAAPKAQWERAKLSVTDGAQWLSRAAKKRHAHARPGKAVTVGFLVSGEALETSPRAAPLSTFRLSRARCQLLVPNYWAGAKFGTLRSYTGHTYTGFE